MKSLSVSHTSPEKGYAGSGIVYGDCCNGKAREKGQQIN